MSIFSDIREQVTAREAAEFYGLKVSGKGMAITKDKKANICILDMPILDTRKGKDLMGTFLSDIVLALLAYIAENERNAIRARQASGIAAAKARGVHFGRRPKPLPANFYEVSTIGSKPEN